jgi:hypothetical protein
MPKIENPEEQISIEELVKRVDDIMNHPRTRRRKQDMQCRELTPREVAYQKKVLGKMIEPLGDRLFTIMGNLTGIAGWDAFNRAMLQRAETVITPPPPPPMPTNRRNARGYPIMSDGTVDWVKLKAEKEAMAQRKAEKQKPVTNYTPPKKKRKK